MTDTERQTAAGKVLWHFTMSVGIRLFDNPGGGPVRLERLNGDEPGAAVNVRYHPVAS